MPLKKTLFRQTPKSPETPEQGDLFTRMRKEIPAVRKQGEPARKDPSAFSRYVCDLCSSSHPITSLRQCSICGKWACPECWNNELYLCNSCSGILKLHQMSGVK